MRQLEEGDCVEFTVVPGEDGRDQAFNIRKMYQSSAEATTTNPGIHPSARENLGHFNSDEKKIINFF